MHRTNLTKPTFFEAWSIPQHSRFEKKQVPRGAMNPSLHSTVRTAKVSKVWVKTVTKLL